MRRFALRWKNFRSVKDTGWLEIRPLTLVIGANASGKTSLLAPLLLLKQTLASPDSALALKTRGELFDAGAYSDLISKHEESRELFLGLRTRAYEGPNEKELKPVGDHRPGQFEFVFGSRGSSAEPKLKQFTVSDIYGRVMVDRRLTETGSYSVEAPSLDDADEVVRDAIREAPPEHFLFTVEPVFRALLGAQLEELGEEPAEEESEEFSGGLAELSMEGGARVYLNAVIYAGGWMEHLLSEISYIGPLRQRPHRLYEVGGERPTDVGTRGEMAPEILYRECETPLMDAVNEWVSRFELGSRVECEEIDPGVYRVTLSRGAEAEGINIADTGFGLSQVLPLVVQGLYANEGAMVIAEQPEIHLNPKLQALLADLFVAMADERRGFLVETHSEHLLLRLRRLVAEGKIRSSDIALYYVEKPDDRSRIREVPIEPNGNIAARNWPVGFFGESLRDSLGLAEAQQEVDKDAR